MPKYAVFLHHGLGDVIMALPALWAVDRSLRGKMLLDVVVKSPIEASVLNAVPWQGRIRTFYLPQGSRAKRILQSLHIIAQLRRSRPEALLTPHLSSGTAARRLARLVGAPVSVLPSDGTKESGVHRLHVEPGEHKSRFYARFFRSAGVELDLDDLPFPPLNLPSDAAAENRILLAPAVGAKSEQHKAWPEARFAALADRMLSDDPDVAIELIGAPTERPLLECIHKAISQPHRKRASIRTADTPLEAACCMIGAQVLVTACSGASHLGAWADIPIVGLYGPTNPCFTGPFSLKLYAVRMGYACAPCYRPGFTEGCGIPKCMRDITVEMVLTAVQSALLGEAPGQLPLLETTNAQNPDLQIVSATNNYVTLQGAV